MVMVYVHDLAAHHRQAVDEGAIIESEPEDMFWGDRRYEAFDPEGHRWHFAQRLRPIRRQRSIPILFKEIISFRQLLESFLNSCYSQL